MDRAAVNRELEAFLASEEGPKLVAYFKQKRVNADDCLQETFARVIAAAERFDAAKKFAAWVWGFAVNVVRERKRGVARDRKRLGFIGRFLGATDPEGAEPAPDEPPEQDEKKALVRKAVAALPEELRVVIELGTFAGMTQEQIAETLGLTVKQVEKRAARAREELARMLRDKGV